MNQFKLPKSSTIQLLETVGLFVGGIIFCIVLDRWFSNRSALESIFGDKASVEVPTYYYAIPELVRDYPDLLKVILEEVNSAGAWAKRQELEAVQRLADHHEIDPSIVETL